MTIELTARLTLSSCVSQLTDFYTSTIMEAIIEHGLDQIFITLVDMDGQVLPYTIDLKPIGKRLECGMLDALNAHVWYSSNNNTFPLGEAIFISSLVKGNMRTQDLFKCALHICGDFIKFNEKQERI